MIFTVDVYNEGVDIPTVNQVIMLRPTKSAISKKRIFASIDNSNFNSIKLINESYQNLKYRLGRIPKLMDFEEHDSLDVIMKTALYHRLY